MIPLVMECRKYFTSVLLFCSWQESFLLVQIGTVRLLKCQADKVLASGGVGGGGGGGGWID